jgi:hypothetical protein
MKKKINGKWEIIHGVMDWSGRTVREAEEARDKTLDRKFDTYDCAPCIAVGGPFIGVVWQTHNGYFSYIIRGLRFPERIEHGRRKLAAGCANHGDWTRLEAENRMRRDLAQKVYGLGEDDGLNIICKTDAEGIAEHRQWVRFQTEYKRLIASGLPDSEAHYRASGMA